MIENLGTGLLIGVIFGMPVGAVGAMSIQRTMKYGVWAGLFTGIASSIADLLYVSVTVFGLTFISDFLLAYQRPIHIIGATLLVIIAVRMICRKKEQTNITDTDSKRYFTMFLSSFLVAISNPAAIISFLFAFSIFQVHGSLGLLPKGALVFGVFVGTFLWWVGLVTLVSIMKRKLKTEWYEKTNLIFGLILIVFSIGVMIKTIS